MQSKYEIVCFYQGKRQPRFQCLTLDNALFWLRWTKRIDPKSKPEMKEIVEEDYALEKTST